MNRHNRHFLFSKKKKEWIMNTTVYTYQLRTTSEIWIWTRVHFKLSTYSNFLQAWKMNVYFFYFSTLGTTLLLSILDESTLWVANVGDSRGVLRNVKGEVIPLSFDHKPSQVCKKYRNIIFSFWNQLFVTRQTGCIS